MTPNQAFIAARLGITRFELQVLDIIKKNRIVQIKDFPEYSVESIRSYISRLSKKLIKHDIVLMNVRGIGYVLEEGGFAKLKEVEQRILSEFEPTGDEDGTAAD